jgi:uncharacterized protein (TIGR04255 family)
MKRPAHLPDFTRYPLNEVVLGVQFARPVGYHQIFAKDVWELYREDFPTCEERQALPPVFETFGPRRPLQPAIKLVSGATHDRYWFVNSSGDQLIQFQGDRLLHNWRKMPSSAQGYSRFEVMFQRFETEIRRFETYVNTLASQILDINQCEVTYTNFIVDPRNPSQPPRPEDWLKFAALAGVDVESMQLNFTKQISAEGKPRARMFYETTFAKNASTNEQAISFQITVRAAPEPNDVGGAMAQIASARELIVQEFANVTTPYAHEVWGRIN